MKKYKLNYNLILIITLVIITILSIFLLSSLKCTKKKIEGNSIFANSQGIVTSADVIIIDGQAPFDDNNYPGNDNSPNNNIVRSNDKLIYEVKPYVNLNGSNSSKLIIKGTLPRKNLIYWNKDEINKFAKGYINYTEDNYNYYFTYERNYNELTSEKGSSTISLYFDVLVSGAKNNELIQPTFEIYMSDNNIEPQKKIIKPNAVKVSSANRCKIELGDGGKKQEKITYNGKVGRMYSTSVYVKIENDRNKKGLIGLEYPQEDILTDMEFKTFLNPKNGGITGEKEELTGNMRPEVMQYCLNSLSDYELKIKENENYPYYYIVDTGLPDTQKLKRVYDGLVSFFNKDNKKTAGDIQVNNITKGSATVKFFNYILNEKNIFPVGGAWNNRRVYPETDGYITAGNIIVFCPFPDKEYIENFLNEKYSSILPEDFNYTVDLEMTLKNKRIKENNKEIQVDRESSKTYICNKEEKPKDESVIRIYEYNSLNNDALPKSEGDDRYSGMFRVVDKFQVRNSITKFYTQDEEYKTYGTALFLKFDGELIEPTGNVENMFRIDKIYYLTKKDGKNWTSEAEMKDARYDVFNYYETLEEAKKHGVVVGIVGQGVKPKESGNLKTNVINYYYAEFKTKENVKPGTVGLFSNMAYNYFKRDYKQDGGDFIAGTFEPPSKNEGYLVLEEDPYTEKTKYDSEGNKINEGNPASYLILNAMPEIKIETNRDVYNLISNQNVINVSIIPSIKTSVRASKSKVRKVKTEITIPKGLEIDLETAKIAGENTKPISVKKDGDLTKVIFEYETTYDEKDYTSKVITFNANIDRTIRNNTNLKIDAITKIEDEAPSYITERQAFKSINIQNALAEIAYQNIKRKVIEYGENFNFEVAMLNNSRNSYSEVTLFDILPYNNRTTNGSNFDGTYTLNNLKSSLNANIYYTTDEKIRNYNAKNYKEAGVDWKLYTGGSIQDAKAIYAISSINPYSAHKITFDILPNGQKAANTYVNDFSTHIIGQGGILQVREKVAIAKRNIQGNIWEDKNIDGKIGNYETKIKDIWVSLKKENGSKVTRLDGTEVKDVKTNENGEYIFEDVPPVKNMKVIMHYSNNMQVTIKKNDNVSNREFEIRNISPIPAIDMNKDNTTLNYIQNLTKYNIGILYKKDITVKKIWENGKNRPAVDVVLYRKIENGKLEKIKEGKIITGSNSDKSSFTFGNFEVLDSNDNIYTYIADEINVPKNYTKKISGDGLTITNAYVIPKQNVTIKKQWINGKVRPDIDIILYRNILGGKKEKVLNATLKTENGKNEIIHIFNNVDKTDISGNEYIYSVDEINVPENYTKKIDNENNIITNTYIAPKQSITGRIIWVNGKKRENITLILYRKDKSGKEEIVDRKVISTEKGKNETTYTWNDLDKTDTEGTNYTYMIDEEKVPENYTKKISEDGLTITNTYVIPKHNVTIKKLWKNGKTRPDINIGLYRNITGGKKEEVSKVTLKTESGKDETTHIFTNLYKTDILGNEYTYSVDELNTLANFSKKIVNNNTILNEYISPKIDIKVTKKWIGGNERPDINIILYRYIKGNEKYKEKVKEQVIKTKEGANESTYIFKNLDKTDEKANEYIYTIDEEKVPQNYIKEIDNKNNIIKNTYVSPKRKLNVIKKWQGGRERQDIQVQLYRNGKKYLEAVTLKTESKKDEARYIYNDLDKTDENGNEYIYTVDEVNTPLNYIKSLNIENTDTNIITNKYISPKVDIVATKKWVGGENVRPDTITLVLYRQIKNGKKEKVIEKEIKVTKDNETTYTFLKQDKTDNAGNIYAYSVEEINVPENYNKEETGLIVTNTYNSPKIDIPVSLIYINGKLKRKDVKIELLRNGKKVDQIEFKVENDKEKKDKYEYIFKDLDKTDKSGKDYNYEIKQITDVKYFVKKEQGLSVVNEYVIPKIDISFDKKWIDPFVEQKKEEKPEIQVQLYKNGIKHSDIILLKEGKTSYLWEKQDRTDKDGKENIYEVKEEIVPKYYNEEVKIKNDNESKKEFEIINKFEMPKVSVKGNVNWNDGPDNTPNTEIILFANNKKVDSITLENGRKDFSFNNLDIYDKNKKEIKYSVEQNILSEKYSKENKLKYNIKYESKIISKEILDKEKDKEFEIINTYIIPKKEITAKKTWINAEGDKPNIVLTLYKDGNKFKEKNLSSGETECTFEDLDETDKKGNVYEYTIDEENVPDGFEKKKTKDGKAIVNIKTKTKEELPYAGLKDNKTFKIMFIIIAILIIKLKMEKKKIYNIGI